MKTSMKFLMGKVWAHKTGLIGLGVGTALFSTIGCGSGGSSSSGGSSASIFPSLSTSSLSNAAQSSPKPKSPAAAARQVATFIANVNGLSLPKNSPSDAGSPGAPGGIQLDAFGNPILSGLDASGNPNFPHIDATVPVVEKYPNGRTKFTFDIFGNPQLPFIDSTGNRIDPTTDVSGNVIFPRDPAGNLVLPRYTRAGQPPAGNQPDATFSGDNMPSQDQQDKMNPCGTQADQNQGSTQPTLAAVVKGVGSVLLCQFTKYTQAIDSMNLNGDASSHSVILDKESGLAIVYTYNPNASDAALGNYRRLDMKVQQNGQDVAGQEIHSVWTMSPARIIISGAISPVVSGQNVMRSPFYMTATQVGDSFSYLIMNQQPEVSVSSTHTSDSRGFVVDEDSTVALNLYSAIIYDATTGAFEMAMNNDFTMKTAKTLKKVKDPTGDTTNESVRSIELNHVQGNVKAGRAGVIANQQGICKTNGVTMNCPQQFGGGQPTGDSTMDSIGVTSADLKDLTSAYSGFDLSKLASVQTLSTSNLTGLDSAITALPTTGLFRSTP